MCNCTQYKVENGEGDVGGNGGWREEDETADRVGKEWQTKRADGFPRCIINNIYSLAD